MQVTIIDSFEGYTEEGKKNLETENSERGLNNESDVSPNRRAVLKNKPKRTSVVPHKRRGTLAAKKIKDPDLFETDFITIDKGGGTLRNMKEYNYFIILPDDPFRPYWDILITFLLLFVCVSAPARIAFTDSDNLMWILIDSVVDSLFLVDIVLDFFFAYHDEEFNLVDDRTVIAKGYMKSWFVIDVMSIIPISIIFNTGDFNSLARIARFPKLYR